MKGDILKHQATPGCCMFSYNIETKEIEFVATVFFTEKEAKNKTVKYYLVPRQEGKIYVQGFNSIHARQRINAFLNHKNKSQNEKEKTEVESNKK